MFQVYITMTFTLTRTEISPVKTIKRDRDHNRQILKFNINWFERYLIQLLLGIRSVMYIITV